MWYIFYIPAADLQKIAALFLSSSQSSSALCPQLTLWCAERCKTDDWPWECRVVWTVNKGKKQERGGEGILKALKSFFLIQLLFCSVRNVHEHKMCCQSLNSGSFTWESSLFVSLLFLLVRNGQALFKRRWCHVPSCTNQDLSTFESRFWR